MKPKYTIDSNLLINMIEGEKRAEYYRYKLETESSLSHICESADALGPLVLQSQLDKFEAILIGESYYSRFRPGDQIEVRIQCPNSDKSKNLVSDYRVTEVIYPRPGQIVVKVRGEKPFEFPKSTELFLFKASSSFFNNLLIRRLIEVSQSPNESSEFETNFDLSIENSEYLALYNALNPTQKEALKYLIENNLNGAIQGPPGTGKTHLLKAIIQLALGSEMRVCLASFTNAAVDNLLGRIVRSDSSFDWTRIGDPDRVRLDLYSKEIANTQFTSRTFSKESKESQLIGATLHKLAFNKSAPKFDLLVIDEAGQVPIYFWPFVQKLAKRVILVGDQYQLPPVLTKEHPNLPFDNIFSLLLNTDTPMLDIQYRMRREIQAWSSEKFYKGKLKPDSSVADRDFFRHNTAFMIDNFVSAKQMPFSSPEKCSQYEANYITDKIEQIAKGNLDISTVGIICPYRAQAGIMNASLQNRFGVNDASKVLVDTVERFQGQEREAIFLSLGASGSSLEELKFLSDPKRLNVSVTRAKSRFMCLYNENLWSQSDDPLSSDLNEFLRWISDSKTQIRRAS